MSVEKLKQLSKDVAKILNENKKEIELIPEYGELLNLTSKLDEKISSAVSQDGTLRIGIVGQVKAGKSSFINALLFDGKDVLPKASTPMTASLTVIKYGEKPSAKIEFYNKKDWEIIERTAKNYEQQVREIAEKYQKEIDESNKKVGMLGTKRENLIKAGETFEQLMEKIKAKFPEVESNIKLISESFRGSYEIVQMAKRSNIDINKYLDKTENISGVSSDVDLVGKLNEYVGAEGKFTPITRNSILELKIDSLKGIELIDTPGVNDPIVSRGLATREFLSKCDTVFLLSSSGQFMGQEDAEFLVNTLPANGVTNIILLGSKFDSVLLDEAKKYNGDIRRAIKEITEKLEKHANKTLSNIISQNPNKPIMAKLKNREIKFVSGIAYNIAKKGRNKLDETEAHILKRLEKSYNNMTFDNDLLFKLARVDYIRENDLAKIKADKKNILADKLNDLAEGQTGEFNKNIEAVKKGLSEKLKELDRADIQKLEKRAKTMETAMNAVDSDVKQIFIELGQGIYGNIVTIKYNIEKNVSSYLGVKIESKSTQESYQQFIRTESTSSWWNPFSWFGTRDIYETRYRTVNYTVANVSDASDQAYYFVNAINEEISGIWNKLVNVNSAEEQLIKTAFKGFDFSDENFNKNQVINPIKNALREIQLSPYRVDSGKYRRQITDSFSSEVRDGQISQLKNKVKEVLEQIVYDINRELDNKLAEIRNVLKEKGDSFVEAIKEHSDKEISQLKAELKNKEQSKAKYSGLIDQFNKLQK